MVIYFFNLTPFASILSYIYMCGFNTDPDPQHFVVVEEEIITFVLEAPGAKAEDGRVVLRHLEEERTVLDGPVKYLHLQAIGGHTGRGKPGGQMRQLNDILLEPNLCSPDPVQIFKIFPNFYHFLKINNFNNKKVLVTIKFVTFFLV